MPAAPSALPPPPPGQTLGYWLGRTMREIREDAGVVASEVAGRVRVSEGTVTRFEKGQTWPRHPDQYLAAYAELVGVPDARSFYDSALKQWRKHGEAPTIEPGTPTQRAAEAARRANRRTKQALDESQRKPPSTQKKRGGG